MAIKQLSKADLEEFFKGLPDMIDIEDLMYRLYLYQKIEKSETDIKEDRVFTHEQAKERIIKKRAI